MQADRGGLLRREFTATLGAVTFCALTACGGAAKGAVTLSQAAADDISRLVGKSVTQVDVPQSVLEDVASRAGIAASDVRIVADDVARQSSWDRLVTRAEVLGAQYSKHEDTIAVAAEVACTAFEQAQELPDPLDQAVSAQFVTPPPIEVVQESEAATRDLYAEMWATVTDDPHARAGVLLFCFAVTDLSGMD